jgi:hypothetical protein
MDRMVKSGLGAFFYTTHPFRNWGILKICLVTSFASLGPTSHNSFSGIGEYFIHATDSIYL